jgi:hypothetical protein
MDAMQTADEITGDMGPDPTDYICLMNAIAAECQQRATNARQWHNDREREAADARRCRSTIQP